MAGIPGLRRIFRLGGRARQVEREVEEELAFHFAEEERRLAAHGLTPEAARADATRRFGDVTRYRAELARIDRGQLRLERRADRWGALRDDVRHALRGVRRQPGFAVMVATTLALGIGANAVMFGVVDRLLLRPPAHVVDPGQLYGIGERYEFRGETIDSDAFAVSAAGDIGDAAPAFSAVVAMGGMTMTLGSGESAEPVRTRFVSGNYFPVLGVRAERGRTLQPADDVAPTGMPVAVISDGFWRRHFGADDEVLGRRLELDRQSYTVVGVAPRGFAGTGRISPDVWVPLHAMALTTRGAERMSDSWQWLTLTGRLVPGMSPAVAGAQVTRALRARAQPGQSDTAAVAVLESVLPIVARRESAESRVASLLFGVSAFVLLIACANVANLLLARAVARQREVAVRLALGVSRARLVRQLLTEGMVLALIGGAGALLVVRWGGMLVERLLLGDGGDLASTVDGRTLLFTTAATVTAGLLAGLFPALQGSRPSLTSALRTGAGDGGGRRSRARASLLTLQTALSVILLVGTGLFVRSLVAVQQTRLGMDTQRVLVGEMALRSQGMETARVDAVFAEAAGRVARLPGVERSAVAAALPLSSSYSTSFSIPGRDSLPTLPDGGPYVNAVSADYLATVGTRVLRGRGLTTEDFVSGAPRVVVVNDQMARLYWRGEDPIGACVQVGSDSLPCFTVVGVMEDARRQSIVEEASLQYVVPLRHGLQYMQDRVLFARLRPDADQAAVAAAVRRSMQELAPDLPYAEVFRMSELLDDEVRPWRLGATMFGAFGLLALVLAAVGTYGVISYGVAQRTRELGVRIALGAVTRDVLWLVVRQGVLLTAVGAAAGVMLAYAGGPLVSELLYETSPRDPLVYAGVVALLLAVAVAASLVPAWRAARVDPSVALRTE
ncbi:MAG: ABC transporter permease [Gemmatimonadaceae bacterium]